MQEFSSIDLQRRVGDVQSAAARAPVMITHHGKPRNVMMSVQEYDRLVAGAPKVVPQHSSGWALRGAARVDAAVEAAKRAIFALDSLGYQAWLVGSLARGNFKDHSDIDIVVDAEPTRRHLAFRIIEEAMNGFEFDMVDFQRMPEDTRKFMMEGAKDASELRAGSEKITGSSNRVRNLQEGS